MPSSLARFNVVSVGSALARRIERRATARHHRPFERTRTGSVCTLAPHTRTAANHGAETLLVAPWRFRFHLSYPRARDKNVDVGVVASLKEKRERKKGSPHSFAPGARLFVIGLGVLASRRISIPVELHFFFSFSAFILRPLSPSRLLLFRPGVVSDSDSEVFIYKLGQP